MKQQNKEKTRRKEQRRKEKKRKDYGVRHHNRSLCLKRQLGVTATPKWQPKQRLLMTSCTVMETVDCSSMYLAGPAEPV